MNLKTRIIEELQKPKKVLHKTIANKLNVSRSYVSQVGREAGIKRSHMKETYTKITLNIYEEDYRLLKDLFGLGYSVQIRNWVHERCNNARNATNSDRHRPCDESRPTTANEGPNSVKEPNQAPTPSKGEV